MSVVDKLLWCLPWICIGCLLGIMFKRVRNLRRGALRDRIAALTEERDSLRAHVEAQDARIKGLEATIACEVSP